MSERSQIPVKASHESETLLLSTLIGRIYAAAGDASLWPELLTGLAGYLEQVQPRVAQAGDADNAESVFLASLAPHFLRAQQIHQQLQQAEVQRHTLDRVMNLLPLGMAVVNARSVVLNSNRALQSLLDDCAWLYLESGCLHSRPATKLREALQEVLQAPERERTLRLGQDKEPGRGLTLWLNVVPGVADQVMVLVASAQAQALSEEGLRNFFGLTAAEARLTQHLALGLSLDESAQLLKVSRNTVRTHLRNVFAKLGVKRQAELIQSVYASPLWLQSGATWAPPSRQLTNGAQHTVACPSMRLADGRRLAYAEYGNPQGRPVLLMHAIAGSRLFRHPDDAWLMQQNLRLIVPERPGLGDSDPMPHREVRHWPQDLQALVDHLQLSRFAVLGYSAGAQYALAVAGAMPQRITRLGLAAPMPPVVTLADLRWYPPVFRMALLVARFTPTLLPAVLRVMVNGIRNNVYQYLNDVLTEASLADQQLFAQPRLRTLYASSLLLGAQQGEQAIAHDVRLAAQPWQAPHECLNMPVQCWHGEADPLVHIDGARALLSQIPQARLVAVPEAGHYVVFARWREVLQWCCAME